MFGIETQEATDPINHAAPRIIVGHVDDPHIRRACRDLPPLSDQRHVVCRIDPSTMVLAGGSHAATAWAVYELAEQYGVVT